jgi:hypothetical protein
MNQMKAVRSFTSGFQSSNEFHSDPQHVVSYKRIVLAEPDLHQTSFANSWPVLMQAVPFGKFSTPQEIQAEIAFYEGPERRKASVSALETGVSLGLFERRADQFRFNQKDLTEIELDEPVHLINAKRVQA